MTEPAGPRITGLGAVCALPAGMPAVWLATNAPAAVIAATRPEVLLLAGEDDAATAALCRRLKGDALLAEVPSVALGMADGRCALLAAGADDYVLLPVLAEELTRKLAHAGAVRRMRLLVHDQERDYARLLAYARPYLPATAVPDRAAAAAVLPPTRRRELAIFYSDIRGFTRLSETVPPERVVDLLNFILYFIFDIILRHGGSIDKVIGDAVMAVFVPRDDRDNAAARAVAAAVAVQREMAQCNELMAISPKLNPDGTLPPVLLGIGINYAEVVQGTLGTPDRMDYTVIGDGVNMASRCQSLAHGGEIIVTAAVAERVRDRALLEELPPVTIKGKTGEQVLFAVTGNDGPGGGA
ncbi:MAG TPA: adenylate/guanylate cyclase domain-containing protein [bacterium]|nr:adenylate/guanylate cyclase domain-containing protein [bacterium]